MPKYYQASRTTYATHDLRQAELKLLEWDVFISHKSEDTLLAEQVASVCQDSQLSVWLDAADPKLQEGVDVADYIQRVLERSKSLLVIVTTNTTSSWWVPFEIGIAFELQRYLASFGHRGLNPSFLDKWPNIPNVPQDAPQRNWRLSEWCEQIRLSPRLATTSEQGDQTYKKAIASMSSRFG